MERSYYRPHRYAHRCDAAVADDVEALFSEVRNEHGTPELVVFNVGSLERGRVAELDAASFENAWRSICFGGFLVGRAAARLMLEAGRGTLIFTGATSALRGKAGFAAPARRAPASRDRTEHGERAWARASMLRTIIDGGIYRSSLPRACRSPRKIRCWICRHR